MSRKTTNKILAAVLSLGAVMSNGSKISAMEEAGRKLNLGSLSNYGANLLDYAKKATKGVEFRDFISLVTLISFLKLYRSNVKEGDVEAIIKLLDEDQDIKNLDKFMTPASKRYSVTLLKVDELTSFLNKLKRPGLAYTIKEKIAVSYLKGLFECLSYEFVPGNLEVEKDKDNNKIALDDGNYKIKEGAYFFVKSQPKEDEDVEAPRDFDYNIVQLDSQYDRELLLRGMLERLDWIFTNCKEDEILSYLMRNDDFDNNVKSWNRLVFLADLLNQDQRNNKHLVSQFKKYAKKIKKLGNRLKKQQLKELEELKEQQLIEQQLKEQQLKEKKQAVSNEISGLLTKLNALQVEKLGDEVKGQVIEKLNAILNKNAEGLNDEDIKYINNIGNLVSQHEGAPVQQGPNQDQNAPVENVEEIIKEKDN